MRKKKFDVIQFDFIRFDVIQFEKRIMLQVTQPLLEQLTRDDVNGILDYYKEDFIIGGYSYTQ